MNRTIKLLFIALGIFTFSGCALHNGYMNNSASLGEANFTYIQHDISGTAKATRIFGIGGLDREAIVQEAKKDMLKKYELQANQALANVTVNWKSEFLFYKTTTKCTVTADIVEFK